MAAKYYVGADVDVGVGKNPYQKLHEVQKKMYETLKPILFGKPAQSRSEALSSSPVVEEETANTSEKAA